MMPDELDLKMPSLHAMGIPTSIGKGRNALPKVLSAA
jgi:hypothetical protein